MKKRSVWKGYSYAWVTLGFFAVSLVGHWLFGWFAFVSEQQEHGQAIELSSYLVEMSRDTFENWQSEFLQLLWQVGGLAYLLYLGSPQSKEGNDRLEAKVDALLKRVDPSGAEALIAELDEAYSGKQTEVPHAHRR